MQVMGIDIGTTTISVIMLDGDSGKLLDSRTVSHHSFMQGRLSVNKIQDADRLACLAKETASELIQIWGIPQSIGLTGQMHGMLYVDKNGQAVSPLYTWQDGSGNEIMEDGCTYARVLGQAAGTASAGYGLTTHFYLQKNGLIPKNAVKMTAISDYVGMRLCERKTPVIARDMAASWGCFDLKKGCFRTEELEDLGVDISYLPEIMGSHGIMGYTAGEFPEGIPVTVSLGDNQASVIGSVQELSDTVLVNIGTGSQVSLGCTEVYDTEGSIELRPCIEGTYLLAGSGLCGGRAYAMLENFYREIANVSREETQRNTSLYDIMEKHAQAFLKKYGKDAAWKIRTTFSGTRNNPQECGCIEGIRVENFLPGAMTVGMIQGIMDELYEMYLQMVKMTGKKAVRLVGSGNGIRRNPLMRQFAEELFGMKMEIPVCREEAAYGAALQALYAAGFTSSLSKAQEKIQYEIH